MFLLGRHDVFHPTAPLFCPEHIQHAPFLQDVTSRSSDDENRFIYDLSAVVIHHGRGFGSGHYTAYCWNDIGSKDFWDDDIKMIVWIKFPEKMLF